MNTARWRTERIGETGNSENGIGETENRGIGDERKSEIFFFSGSDLQCRAGTLRFCIPQIIEVFLQIA